MAPASRSLRFPFQNHPRKRLLPFGEVASLDVLIDDVLNRIAHERCESWLHPSYPAGRESIATVDQRPFFHLWKTDRVPAHRVVPCSSRCRARGESHHRLAAHHTDNGPGVSHPGRCLRLRALWAILPRPRPSVPRCRCHRMTGMYRCPSLPRPSRRGIPSPRRSLTAASSHRPNHGAGRRSTHPSRG